jgi:polar amino acid transport system substrate-binding protein
MTAPARVRRRRAAALLIAPLALVVVTACSGSEPAASDASASAAGSAVGGDPATDKLAQVMQRGTLVLSTDLEYPPQSMLVEGAARAADTKCADSQLTGPEVTGYDVETGKAVADRLGLEPCFVAPDWSEVVSGTWGDRWDVSWGSGNINGDRMTRLWMTQPYRSEPSRFFVRDDSAYSDPSELSGAKVGACAGCTHEAYLRRTLTLPGIDFDFLVDDPQIATFDVESPGLQAVADGKIDAFLSAEQVGQEAIASGLPLRALDPPAFTGMLSGFVDKKSGLDPVAFVERINAAVAELHDDGTLAALSEEFFGTDYATAAEEFDLSRIGQTVE